MTERNLISLWLAAVILLAGLSVFGWVSKADCAYCPSFTCYGPGQCGSFGCVCLKPPNSIRGSCVSID